MMGYTREEKERLITWVLYPSPIATWATNLTIRLYSYAERTAGYDSEDDFSTVDLTTWPLRARIADWLGDRADDLSRWANHRKTVRRLKKK
jgi:hypothetical protein